MLERDASILWEIIPEERATAVYEKHDGIFLPFAGFEWVTRPGPAIKIYRLELRNRSNSLLLRYKHANGERRPFS